jgi:hypothetical protein
MAKLAQSQCMANPSCSNSRNGSKNNQGSDPEPVPDLVVYIVFLYYQLVMHVSLIFYSKECSSLSAMFILHRSLSISCFQARIFESDSAGYCG